jgi:hypothetical protein
MSATVIFDTLQYAKKLKEAGVPEKQAEVQAEALAEIVEDRITTKQDLKELEVRLDLKLAELKADIIKWVAAMLVAQAAVIAALVKLIK